MRCRVSVRPGELRHVLRVFPDVLWRARIYGGGVKFRGRLWDGWHRGWRFALLLAAVASVAIVAASTATPASGAKSKHTVRVMTRNLYLGADLTPALQATSFSQLTDAAGEIFNEVKQNDFPVRAKGLAKEILKTSPDLVGLQEAALWRTSPTCKVFVPPGPYTATHVAYDYVKLLLAQLNKGKTALPGGGYRARVRLRGRGEHQWRSLWQLQRGRQADDARRDPRPCQRRRAGEGREERPLQGPVRAQAARHDHGTRRQRLDQRRRQGPRQPLGPVHRHAP